MQEKMDKTNTDISNSSESDSIFTELAQYDDDGKDVTQVYYVVIFQILYRNDSNSLNLSIVGESSYR